MLIKHRMSTAVDISALRVNESSRCINLVIININNGVSGISHGAPHIFPIVSSYTGTKPFSGTHAVGFYYETYGEIRAIAQFYRFR